MIEQEIEIINKLGLHARASAKLTQLAAKYKSEVWMTRNKRRVNAKSIMGVMMPVSYTHLTLPTNREV